MSEHSLSIILVCQVLSQLLHPSAHVSLGSSVPRKVQRVIHVCAITEVIQHWNLANLVKNYHGIIGLQHLIDQKQIELQNELYDE